MVDPIAAVNAVSGAYQQDSHQILARAIREDGQGFRDMMPAIMDGYRVVTSLGSNTTIGAIDATVMAQAVARAVVQAESLTEHQLPAHRDYVKG